MTKNQTECGIIYENIVIRVGDNDEWLIMSRFIEKKKIAPDSSKKFLDIQATTESGFTLKHICGMIRTHSPSPIYSY